ncbi:MAG: hypothetical protein ABSD43_04080 [Terracidiphilus sp.]|jgi:hypothetical protein
MALLDEKNLAAEAAKRARYRVRHVGTKLNEAEAGELEALAAKRKQTHAELIRGLILAEVERDQAGLQAGGAPLITRECGCPILPRSLRKGGLPRTSTVGPGVEFFRHGETCPLPAMRLFSLSDL